MKTSLRYLAAAAAALVALSGCHNAQTNEPETDGTPAPLQEVAGRKNFGAAHALVTTPQPCIMIATWDENKNPDVMMAAWGGQYEGNQVCFQLSSHKTTENIRLNKAFTLSFADARTVAESDYFGIASGRDVKDKIAHVGFHCTKSQNVNAPIIDEYPLAMECKVVELIERENDGAFVVGEIVNAVADPSILTDGKIDIKKLNPLVWDGSSLNYFTIADSVGKAWNSGMKLK